LIVEKKNEGHIGNGAKIHGAGFDRMKTNPRSEMMTIHIMECMDIDSSMNDRSNSSKEWQRRE
jgi:hypothetical protein